MGKFSKNDICSTTLIVKIFLHGGKKGNTIGIGFHKTQPMQFNESFIT